MEKVIRRKYKIMQNYEKYFKLFLYRDKFITLCDTVLKFLVHKKEYIRENIIPKC